MKYLCSSRIQFAAFTLVELLVVLGLFSGIATLSLGSLLNAQTLNNRLQETQSILDNVNLSSQTVSRDIRFGSNFNCATTIPLSLATVPLTRKNCPYGVDGLHSGSVIIFKPANAAHEDDRVAYYVKDGILYKNEYPKGGGAVNTLQMTANEVTVLPLMLYIDGALASDPADPLNGGNGVPVFDYRQPIITLLLSGTTNPANKINAPIPFNLQTSISARAIDNR